MANQTLDNFLFFSNGYGAICANDANHQIVIRGDRSGTQNDYTNYYQYGGTLAAGLGHKFWTGGTINSQTLKVQFADNGNYFACNVGIGTTSPSDNLHIAASEVGNVGIAIQNTNASYSSQIRFLNSAGGECSAITYVQASNFLAINVNGGNRLNITGAGNVGIGTESPSNLLHVCGAPTSNGLVARFQSTASSGSISISHSGNGGNIGYASLGAGVLSNVFYVTTGTGTIGPGIAMNNGGYVGIGTCTPGERLSVNGNQGQIQLRVDTSDGSTINVRPNSGRCGWISYTEDAVADRWGIGIKNGDAKLYFASGNVASGGGTTRMVLDGSGNVGIGTPSPSTVLDIRGCNTDNAVTVRNFCGDSYSAIGYVNCQGTLKAAVGIGNNSAAAPFANNAYVYTPASTDFLFYIAGAERMRVRCDGNVGIGCATPGSKLTVAGNAYIGTGAGEYFVLAPSSDLIICDSNSTGTFNQFMDSNVAYVRADTSAGNGCGTIRFNDNVLIVGCRDGRVGIGTTTPSYKLHVNGTFYAAGSSIKYKEGICQYDTDSCLFMCLKPVTYQYKDEWQHLGRELKSQSQIGLIAEDVAEVMPELAVLVNEDDEKVVRNVDYEKLSVVLLKEVQKLRQEVDELKNNK